MYRCIYVLCVNVSQGDAPGSVPQPKIAFPPCSNDCDGKCVDKCPDYCCVKVVASKTSGQTQPPSAPQPSQVITVISIYGLGLICKVLLKHCIFQVASGLLNPSHVFSKLTSFQKPRRLASELDGELLSEVNSSVNRVNLVLVFSGYKLRSI